MTEQIAATTATATPTANSTNQTSPTPATTTATPPPAPGPDYRAEFERLRVAHDKRVKEAIIERRKFEAQLKELSPKAQRLAELEKRDALAKLNPPKYLESVFGEKWYDTIVESKLNGAPPADVVAAEISRVEDKFNAELAKRDAAAKAQQEAAAKAQHEGSLRQIRDDMAYFFVSSKADYPALEARYGNAEAVGNAMFAKIKQAWDASAKYDESGRLVSDTKAMTFKEAADELEKQEREYATKVNGFLTPKSTSISIPPSKLQQGSQQQSSTAPQQTRKTLSNDITGSTPSRQPPANLEERRRRAIDAYNEARRR